MSCIVVIDDDASVREGVSRYLRLLGHDVVAESDGRRALSAAAGRDVHLYITDINMPDMDGIEVINELRERSPDSPVIAMSGGGLFSKDLLLQNASMLGAFAVIPKPFDLAELGRQVEAALRAGGSAGAPGA